MSAEPFETVRPANGLPEPTAAPGSPAPVANGLQMKRRDPVGVWLYKIHSELEMFDRRRIVGATGPVMAWIFGIVTLMIWPLISTYDTGQTIAATQRCARLAPTCSGGLGVALVFVFGLHSLYYQTELNKIVAVNNVPEGTAIPLYA